ncbi:UNVERIFIED_CONTAM: Retrovirus-related Pol polyprotein from transposon TNT 1-94 [Sesamum angustifolium]|uniref:Retrovirus-related Pol polyprotein from transposon TNT 1-94 n=1 Tax=Sesamum angustifolium TaxID=2727405 RepID=A0AAW2PWR6_9LAMI
MITLLANHFKLSSEQCPKTDREIEDMGKVSYASAVGCLMYTMCTRPNLAHVVSQVSKYMSKPGGGPIRWKSMPLSTIESKYMVVAKAAKEALWFNGLSNELGVEQDGV